MLLFVFAVQICCVQYGVSDFCERFISRLKHVIFLSWSWDLATISVGTSPQRLTHWMPVLNDLFVKYNLVDSSNMFIHFSKSLRVFKWTPKAFKNHYIMYGKKLKLMSTFHVFPNKVFTKRNIYISYFIKRNIYKYTNSIWFRSLLYTVDIICFCNICSKLLNFHVCFIFWYIFIRFLAKVYFNIRLWSNYSCFALYSSILPFLYLTTPQ